MLFTRGRMAIEREGGIIVDSGQLIGLIIGIVVVLAIVIVAIMLGRKRKAAANRTKAVEMRDQARTEEIGAREREAKAARAEADAKQAEVEAERLREEARGRQQEAEQVRSGVQDQLRKADELDPDVATGKRGHGQDHVSRDAAGTEELRRDRSDRNPGQGEQASPLAGEQAHRTEVPGSELPPEQGHTGEPRSDPPRNL
ncbi:FtsZ-interacting cell division protein ZipA [Arthrobacter sp. MP_M7]|nr:FtsZ-interacting cell division protein ZipA [Arthrobacter sp. MP_M4]MEC5203532.1 FtsZ-interacting cell division protein ZipA [Arthrobacter sp. MP_M7]